jgi:hypothetical protein
LTKSIIVIVFKGMLMLEMFVKLDAGVGTIIYSCGVRWNVCEAGCRRATYDQKFGNPVGA